MPRYATELTQGQAFSRTSQEGGVNDTAQRVYKIVLLHPGEVFYPQEYTGTYIGSRHPSNLNLICTSFDAKFDGDSRMVSIVTFNYQSYASSSASGGRVDPKTVTPAARPANWTTDVSLVEIPAPTWRAASISTGKSAGNWRVPINPAGDRYEGVTKLVPQTTIRIDQLEANDPLLNNQWVGYINSEPFQVGSLGILRHTLLLRGISSKPHVETFGDQTFRGWMATYEFSHRENYTKINDAVECSPGWDRLQIVEGYNVMNVAGAENRADVDSDGLALEHANYEVVVPRKIVAALVGKKSKAMVAIPSVDARGGMFQRPASSPIALNSDGTPRLINPNVAGALDPTILRYQVQNEIDFAILNLRLT
jgi:hypothetical protein